MSGELTRVADPERRIDKAVAGPIQISTTGGLAVRDMAQAMEVAKLMSVSGQAVPAHLRNNAGGCLAIAIQGWEWGINPFAIANKTYVVNDRLAYESALYHAVLLRRAPIIGRIKMSYDGEGMTRRCKVWATARPEESVPGQQPETVEYQSPQLGNIKPRNSPLWVNDPDQQLFYFSARAFARRHFPDVMMGVYTSDELMDNPAESGTSAVDDMNRVIEVKATRKIIEQSPNEPQTIDASTAQAPAANTPDPLDNPDQGAGSHDEAPGESGTASTEQSAGRTAPDPAASDSNAPMTWDQFQGTAEAIADMVPGRKAAMLTALKKLKVAKGMAGTSPKALAAAQSKDSQQFFTATLAAMRNGKWDWI